MQHSLTAQESPERRGTAKIDLASSGGAALLGAGVAPLLASVLGPFAVPLVAVGGTLHVWGMLARRRLDLAARPWWAEALFWLCWAILLAVAALALRDAISR